jgi:MFS family permease
VIVSNVGSQMQVAGQGWLVRDMSPEPVYLGLVSLASAVPLLLLTPFGGAIADRFPRRRLLYVTQVGMLLQAIALAALTLAGAVQLWHILLLAALGSACLAADSPGRQALLPDLVSPDQLPSAISLYSVVWSGAQLFGPALAGVLLGPAGPGGLFALNAVSYLAILFALVRLRGVRDEVARRPDPVLTGVLNGLRYVRDDRLSRSVLLLIVLASVFGRSYQSLMPIFARDVLRVGPEGYGLLLAAPGAGAMLGGLGLAASRSARRRDLVLLGTVLAFGGLLFVFAVAGSFAVAVVCLLLAGLVATVFSATASTLLQLGTPRHLRGRVMSLATAGQIGVSQLGGMGSASVATLVGAPAAVAIGAGVLVALALVVGAQPGWREQARKS